MSIVVVNRLKFALLLPIAHFAIAVVLIGSEDSRYSRLEFEAIERSDRVERQERLHPTLEAQSNIFDEQDLQRSMENEYRPTAAVRAILGVELPAVAVVGWFRHPPTAHPRGLLQPLLYRITLGISALRKILLLDSFLILAICEQWWLVGRWLDAREGERKPVKFKRGLAMLITIAGLVSAILCRARDFWEFVAALVAFLAAIAWLVLLVTAAVAVAKSVRSFFRGTPTPQN